MAQSVLDKEKREKLLEMLAGGETYALIAETVGCSVQNIQYYAVKYRDRIKELEETHEGQVMRRGFANKTFRVRKLNRLAEMLEREIEGLPKLGEEDGHGIWLRDVKFSPTGQKIDLEVYAGGLVNDYMKVMGDIAKEKGERINKAEVEVKGNLLAEFVNLKADDV